MNKKNDKCTNIIIHISIRLYRQSYNLISNTFQYVFKYLMPHGDYAQQICVLNANILLFKLMVCTLNNKLAMRPKLVIVIFFIFFFYWLIFSIKCLPYMFQYLK